MPELRVAFIISPGTCPPDLGALNFLCNGNFLRLRQSHMRARERKNPYGRRSPSFDKICYLLLCSAGNGKVSS